MYFVTLPPFELIGATNIQGYVFRHVCVCKKQRSLFYVCVKEKKKKGEEKRNKKNFMDVFIKFCFFPPPSLPPSFVFFFVINSKKTFNPLYAKKMNFFFLLFLDILYMHLINIKALVLNLAKPCTDFFFFPHRFYIRTVFH